MSKQSWYSMTARAAGLVTDIFIFDVIDPDFGVSAKDFVQDLARHADSELVVRINCPGGSVFDGLAIYNALNQHKQHVECRVEGLAASMGSVIALAGDVTTIAATGTLMVHDPSMLVMGQADALRDAAMTLDKLRDTIAGVYTAKTKRPRAEVLKAMSEERWFNATEAKDWGLVDRIERPLKAAALFDLTGYKNVPEAFKPRQDDPGDLDQVRAELKTLKDTLAQLNTRVELVTDDDGSPAPLGLGKHRQRNDDSVEGRFARMKDQLAGARGAWGAKR